MNDLIKFCCVIVWIGLLPQITLAKEPTAVELKSIITAVNQASKRHAIDPYLLLAVMRAESNFNRWAKSWAGARGLMQLMPVTQRELGVVDVFDIQQNVNGGAAYLVQQIKRYNDVRKGLWAYNTGPGNVDKGVIPGQTKRYASQVIRFYKHYKKRGRR